ncbi:membrane protein [[Actinobacillus] muris]|uniref:Membrane protein n=1 Tax=Muribacter muris TaxID=67855 RepID=A0A0J5P455_9PAST|nr:type IVB secretion system protein IcmH/DotU [Muribacter muris]KMK51076.1 membrane protein [[Actinobacillus] muris] [Muribacter muris]
MAELDYHLSSDELDLAYHYHLALRGHNINPMIDAATPLLGMVLRLKELADRDIPKGLYQQVVRDITAIEHTLQAQHYEPAVVVSFRYILCTFIDEIALGHGWDRQSDWYKQSLLTHFHNETWGGEKVYLLLDKLLTEPKRYKELLEFLFLCFSLGFRGRYKVQQSSVEFNEIYQNLYRYIRELTPEPGQIVLHHTPNLKKSRYLLLKKWGIKHYACLGLIILSGIYSVYAFKLHYQTQAILKQIGNLLH